MKKKSRKIVKRTQGWNMVWKVRLHWSQVAQETHRKDAGFSPRVPFPKKIEKNKATSNMPKEGCRDPGRWQWEGNGSWPQLELEYV